MTWDTSEDEQETAVRSTNPWGRQPDGSYVPRPYFPWDEYTEYDSQAEEAN